MGITLAVLALTLVVGEWWVIRRRNRRNEVNSWLADLRYDKDGDTRY